MSRSDLDKLAASIAQKLSLRITEKLGSGENGVAFDVGGRVLKITLDGGEYIQASKFKGKNTKHLSDVYSTWVVNVKGERVYVLLKEKVDVSNASEKRIRSGKEALSKAWDDNDVINVVGEEGVTEFMYFYQKGSYGHSDRQNILNAISENKEAVWFLMQMTDMFDEMRSHGIVSADYWDNLGLKNGDIVYYDIGYGNMQDVEMNYLQLQEIRNQVKTVISALTS